MQQKERSAFVLSQQWLSKNNHWPADFFVAIAQFKKKKSVEYR
jgi:hypothetical protein